MPANEAIACPFLDQGIGVLSVSDFVENIISTECPPQLHGKLRHFMEFVSDEGNHDMPDPYGGGPQGFELVLDLARTGSVALLSEIRERWLD